MSNSRQLAFKRMQELKTQKVGSTIITVPKVVRERPKVRRRTDEIHAELVDEFWRKVEEKSIDLSRWDGQGSPWEHRHIMD